MKKEKLREKPKQRRIDAVVKEDTRDKNWVR